MKAPRLKTPVKNSLLGILIVTIFSFTSCSTKTLFLPSTVVPAAKGSVNLKKDNNNNYVIQIRISNLAAVEKLQTAKQTYVVWMVTDQGETKNIGQLKSSKSLNASFETVSSSKPTKIFITDELDEGVQYPLGQVVLTTGRF